MIKLLRSFIPYYLTAELGISLGKESPASLWQEPQDCMARVITDTPMSVKARPHDYT